MIVGDVDHRGAEAGLQLRLRPAFPDQELDTKSSTRVVYWEGNVLVQGSHNGQAASGAGYVELVGYKMKIDL